MDAIPKIIDDKDQELEIIKDNYVSVIPSTFQWRNWEADPEGITADELLKFIDSNAQSNKGLFASLLELNVPNHPKSRSSSLVTLLRYLDFFRVEK